MPGTLHIVATPIGNLEDITLRALRVLREAAVIAAEDTRHTAKLLIRHGIDTPTVSYHEHSGHERLPQLLTRLMGGEHVALVTDAGTPAVSDPGSELVAACIAAGIRVEPVPGPNAPLTAAVASGFALVPFTFMGFAPSKAAARREWMFQLAAIRHTSCFFEAPTRIVGSLTELSLIMGNRQICVARELTKLHEEFLRGSAGEIVGVLTEPKGEFTIVVAPEADSSSIQTVSDEEILLEFRRMTEAAPGSRRREIVAVLARQYNRRSSDVYAIVERHRSSGE